MSEKKRKRESENDGRATKRTAVTGPPTTVKVSAVSQPDEWAPVIASTPGLSIPNDIILNPYKKAVQKNAAPPNIKTTLECYEILLQSSTHPRLDYIGREEQDGTAEGLLKHYVGVYDPETGNLKIMEAHRVVIRSILRSEETEVEEETKPKKPTTSTLRNALGMEFGTKKAKKAIASLTENAISPQKQPLASSSNGTTPSKPTTKHDPIAAAVLNSMTASANTAPSRDALQAAVDEAKPRPKVNINATTTAEVYPLHALISSQDMAALPVKEWQDAAQAGQAIDTTSRFVSKRLHALASGDDVRKLKVLRYIYALLEFYHSLKGGGRGPKKMPQREDLRTRLKVQDSVIEGIRRKFTAQGELTKWHVDNLMTHIAALSLILDNFETDTHDLREDLRLDNIQMTQYFRELGCKVVAPTEAERAKAKLSKAEAAGHKMAKLRLPLEFPKQRVMAVKKRR